MKQNMMKAAVLYGKKDLRIVKRDIPEPAANEVLIKIEKVGICGSDIHYYREGRIGDFIVEKPMILGHECAGTIAETGKDVKTLKIGDRVAIEPGVPCMQCRHCKEGRYNLCQNIFFFATPPDDGSLCEYVSFPADYTYKLPEAVSLEEGAMIEPLSVGLFAIHRAQPQLGDTVVILGSGTIGLMTLQASIAAGAGFIAIADIDDNKLKFAKELGANLVVNTSKTDIFKKLEEYGVKEDIDIVYDAVGIGATAIQSVDIARVGGKVIWLGLSNEEKTFPFGKVAIKELEIRGMFRYSNTYPPAVKALAQGSFELDKLITKRISLDEVPETMRQLSDGELSEMKVMVDL